MVNPLLQLQAALAARYKIEGELGRGGMATVYLAEDLKHHRKVAVKVLHSELAATVGADRFLREIEVAAKLTHPHVLPLHDSGNADGLLYYVMPYIAGESLRQRIARERLAHGGGVPLGEALRIANGVAEALDHAHRHNVVHRDIKPENILLVDGHAVVTDFGIARALDAAGGDTLTQVGWQIGTPAYMSPEQAMASPDVDGRTDIYSLGLVLYEMVIGALPRTPAERRSVMTDTPSGQRRRVAALPETVREALAKALAEDPSERLATAQQFAAALAPVQARRSALPTRRSMVVAAMIIAAAGIVGSLLWRTVVGTGATLAPNRVLVATFENETGDSTLDLLGAIAVDWLSRGLQETGLAQVIDARAVSSGTGEPGTAGNVGLAGALTIARDASAGTVVSGAYYRQRDSLQFQARITATETGMVLHSLTPVSGPADEPLETVEILRQRVAGAMASILDQTWPPAFAKPPTYEAYREYVTAIPLIGRQDYSGAIAHFLRAAALDTSFTLPLIYAAVLMTEVDRFGPADSLLGAVDRVRGRLPALEVHMLEYIRGRLRGDFASALAALRPVAEAAPLSEATWEVAQMLLRLNRPRAALEVLAGLDPTRGFLKHWWFFWNVKGAAHHVLGDYGTELRTARDGRSQFPNEVGVALAELLPVAALGRIDELDRLLDEMVGGTPPASEDPHPPMWHLTEAAKELRAHGNHEAARDLLNRVQRWAQGATADAPTTHRIHIALVTYLAGQWDEALSRFQALADEFPGNVDYRGYLGTVAARRGDLEQARSAAEWLANVDRPYLYGMTALWQARITALLGEPDRAMRHLRAAFDQGLTFFGTSPFLWISGVDNAWVHRDIDLEPLHDLPAFQEFMRPKG